MIYTKTYKVCEPTLTSEEIKLATAAMLRNEVSGKGEYVERFETAFAKLIGAKYAVAMSNGSTALLAALQALDIGPGDEVICPTFTMAAPALAVKMLGAECRWVDCNADGNINTDLVEEKISIHTKAIIAVHVYGIPANIRSLKRFGLPIIEDAAEAHGAKIGTRCVGTIGDIGCFSFYANKIITTGEGGMCVTNSIKHAERLRELRDYSQRGFYKHYRISLNYRLSSILAAVGLAQCERFWDYVKKRNQIADWYDMYFRDFMDVRERPKGSVNWMYGILADDQKHFMDELAKAHIETRPFFVPMHRQPFNGTWDTETRYPISEHLSEHGIYLPSSTYLQKHDVEFIADAVKKVA